MSVSETEGHGFESHQAYLYFLFLFSMYNIYIMKICIIPIDNRPVCYNLIKDISDIDNDIELLIPPREYLGDLTKKAKIDEILNWLKNTDKFDKAIIALDTIAYGGLIPSRRSPDSFEDIKKRIYLLKEILNKKNCKIYAFSSIMRISNNNINEEEKPYWDKYGKKIFDYSYYTHKNGIQSCVERLIPDDILDDYLSTRKRNFEINKLYLDWQKEGFFDTLIFSKDDCAEYGFNVQEAIELEKMGGITKTGADEIPLTLFARAIDGNLKVDIEFLEPEYKNLISNYEDVSIEKSVQGQLQLAGCEITNKDNSDITLIVNNFINEQGEIVMKRTTIPYNGKFETDVNKRIIIADVRYANGADNAFVEKFINNKMSDNFYGYSAWNTSANTLGSLICAAKVKFLAKKYNNNAFKKLECIRFLDDWAYQANVRQKLQTPDNTIKDKMKPFEKRVFEFLNETYNIEYSYPWNRLFETEVTIK